MTEELKDKKIGKYIAEMFKEQLASQINRELVNNLRVKAFADGFDSGFDMLSSFLEFVGTNKYIFNTDKKLWHKYDSWIFISQEDLINLFIHSHLKQT